MVLSCVERAGSPGGEQEVTAKRPSSLCWQAHVARAVDRTQRTLPQRVVAHLGKLSSIDVAGVTLSGTLHACLGELRSKSRGARSLDGLRSKDSGYGSRCTTGGGREKGGAERGAASCNQGLRTEEDAS